MEVKQTPRKLPGEGRGEAKVKVDVRQDGEEGSVSLSLLSAVLKSAKKKQYDETMLRQDVTQTRKGPQNKKKGRDPRTLHKEKSYRASGLG